MNARTPSGLSVCCFPVNPWTTERVLALAPDPASASAGQSLASMKKWTGLGKTERALWGLCQGSGKDPYQARIDLSEPAFKCTCPSRKFPCKHGLGLLLLFAKDESIFKAGAEPGWVADWLATRAEKAEKKVEKAKAAAEKPVDVEAQAKRAAQRESRVLDGVQGCRVWLEDLLRRGLAAAQTDSGQAWERMAARMVDCQAPGIAGYIRQMPEIIGGGKGWEVIALDHLGKLHLLLRAAERLGELPPELATDARTAIGWNQSKEEVLATASVSDRWTVLGQITEEEDRFRARRTWLVGRSTGTRALILDFAAGLAPLDASIVIGTEFDAELAFYPSGAPLRALVKTRSDTQTLGGPLASADASIEDGLKRYAQALAGNPWVFRWPLVLSSVRLAQGNGRWYLVDQHDDGLPMQRSFVASVHKWRLLSSTAGEACDVLVEWDGHSARPLSAISRTPQFAFHDLAPRWGAGELVHATEDEAA